MANRVRLEIAGLDEFRAALRNLPADLTDDATTVVLDEGEQAKREIVAAYVEGPTGNLKRGVTVERGTSQKFTTSAIVRSRARHAHLYEFGSQLRRHDSGKSVGSMPAKPTFVPIMQRRRKSMVNKLRGVLQRAGLLVTGDAGL